MSISSTGIGSGLDVDSIVSQLVAIERRPIAQLQTAATFIETQISAYGQMQSLVSGVRDAAAALAKSSLWQKSTATSSDGAAVAVSATSGATPGTYSVTVGQLASGHTLASGAYASASAVIGAGQLTIEIGTWDAGQTTLTPKQGTSAVVIDLTDPNTTLEQVRDRINAANAGVTASIVTDASGARLSVSSKSTGLDSQIRIGASGALGVLQFPPAAGVGLTQKQAAANATATINGIDIESTSNQISGALDGVSLTLGKAGAAASVTVGHDVGSQRKAVQDLVAAYNALNAFIAEQTRYDEKAKIGGTLQGDSTAVGLRNQVRSLLRETTTASSQFTGLTQVGFDVQRDGSIKIDSSKLDKALAMPAEMSKLFGNVSPDDPGARGVAERIRAVADKLTGSEGALQTRNEGLQARLKRNKSDQDRLEDRVERTRQRLLKQYQALDVRVGQLNSLAGYVTQQLTMLNAQFKSSND